MISKPICKEIRQVNNGFLVELCLYNSIHEGFEVEETICITWDEVIKLLSNQVIPPTTITIGN